MILPLQGLGDQQLTLLVWDGVSCAGSEGRGCCGICALCFSHTVLSSEGTEVAHEE